MSKSLDALVFHEAKDTVISVFVESDKELLKLRHFPFRDDQHTAALRNKIVICKNDGRALVAIQVKCSGSKIGAAAFAFHLFISLALCSYPGKEPEENHGGHTKFGQHI